MIRYSTRIYSLKEINQFIENNKYPIDFLEYLKVAPGNIKELLKVMGVDDQYLLISEKNAEESSNSEENAQAENTSLDNGDNNSSIVLQMGDKEKEENHVQESIPVEGTSNYDDRQDNETLYKNLRFGDNITVKRLVLHEMKSASCNIHSIEYEKIRVIVLLPQGKFAIRTRCCPVCKKLFVQKENFQRVKKILDSKKINYVWVPEGE